ncbi:MAG: hypothetical protein ACRDZN_13630, partial [Acidimicrobiales bacterium]
LALIRPPDAEAGDQALIRVVVQPLVMWLWIGGGVMAAGTVLAAFPGRRRSPLDPASASLVGAAREGAHVGGADRAGATGPEPPGGNGRGDHEPVEVPT